MGIIASNVKLLLSAYKAGVSFEKTATLGRLSWYLDAKELAYLARLYDLDIARLTVPLAFGGPADRFFYDLLGVKSLSILDNSPYEGANLVLDLNKPIPGDIEEAFDAVVESGTLEHVFNFPMALANVMRMAKLNGTVFLCVPSNNSLGHGFYQIGPEAFFRAFQPENGFVLEKIFLLRHPYMGAELSARQRLYEVADPSKLGERVCLTASFPVQTLVQAKRVAIKPIFSAYPQQSDYAKAWEGGARREAPAADGLKNALKRLLHRLPQSWQNLAHGWRQNRLYSIRNRRFFRPVGEKI